MSGRKIICFPGKNPKPEPEVHREMLLRCIEYGLARSNPDIAGQIEKGGSFEICAWNHVFYQEHAAATDEIPWLEEMLQAEGPTRADRRQARTLRLRIARMIYSLVDRFPWLISPLQSEHVKRLLDGSSQYFENLFGIGDDLRAKLRRQLQQAISEEQRILLIGHSMGSIIAYDTLWQLSREGVGTADIDLFLTLGSPLGLRYTQDRLLGYCETSVQCFPKNIRMWKNVSAQGDLVSIDRTLEGDFAPMRRLGLVEDIEDHCKGVFNWYRNADGLVPHRSYGYLVNPVVSGIIADWWTSGR